MFIVFDPSFCYHTKVASVQRAGERESARATAFQAKTETMRISTQLRMDNLTHAQRLVLLEDLKKIQATVKKAETKSQQLVPADFQQRMIEEIDKLSKGLGVEVFTSDYQADSMIAKLVMDGKADIILASDSDFSFICGERGLQITSFKLDESRNELKDLVMKSGILETIKGCC